MSFDFSKNIKNLTAFTVTALALSSTALEADSLDLGYSMDEQIQPCVAGEYSVPRALVDVSGIESDEGTLRLQIYSDNPDDFLISGKKGLRVEVPSQPVVQKVCVTFPATGVYSMAVMHDTSSKVVG